MKRVLCLLTTTLLLSTLSLALAQGTDKKAEKKGGGGVEQALLETERKWAAAALKSDAAAIDVVLADTWSVINAEGKTISRAQSLDDTKKSKLTRSELSEMKVRMINADVAIVTGVWTGAGTDAKGEKFDTSERWTDVFANQGGKWKCVASQNSTIKK